MNFRKKFIGITKRVGIIKVSERDKQLANSHINIGIKRKSSSNIKEALNAFNEAIMLDPYNHKAFCYKAQCELNLKNYDKSLENLNKSIELSPEYAEAYLWRGISNYVKKTNESKYSSFMAARDVIEDIILATELEPDNTFYLLKRSLFYEFVRKYDLAIKDLNVLIEYEPNNGELFFKRGNLKQLLTPLNLKGACVDWSKAYNLGFKDALEKIDKKCNIY